MTLLLIGGFFWLWVCVTIAEKIDDMLLGGVCATVLFFLPITLFVDFVKVTT